MGTLTDLFRELDPAALMGDDPRYVDWQQQLDSDDVKPRLINSIWNSPRSIGSIRLLTGPRGAGKSSELRQVERRLREGMGDRHAFVSFLEMDLFDLDDITATDVSFNMVRQLVADLRRVNIDLTESPFASLVRRLGELSVNVDVWGVSLSTALKEQPSERRKLREVINGELPGIWDRINRDVIRSAEAQFREHGIDRIVILVDDLDKVQQRSIRDDFTNLDELFLSEAGKLKALACDVVLTVPVSYWYSAAGNRLSDLYGEVIELGLPPTVQRDGSDGPGLAALRAMLDNRFERAGVGYDVVDGGLDRVDDLVRSSGGQIRRLFEVLRGAITRSADGATIAERDLDRAIANQRRAVRSGLNAGHWDRLEHTATTFEVDTTDPLAAELLRTARILPYVADDGEAWYGVDPLLLSEPWVLDR